MDRRFNLGLRAAVYLLASIILWLCLRPIMVLTLLHSGSLFALFIGITMLLLFLRIPRVFIALEGGLMIPYCLHYYYYSRIALVNPEWIIHAARNVAVNARNVWQGDLIHLSNVFVSFLLFFVLWFIILVLHYELKNERFILFFSFAVLSQCIAESATKYNAPYLTIAIVSSGLILLGLLNFIKETARTDSAALGPLVRWMAGVSVLIVLLVIFAAGIPKPNAHWGNPLPNLLQQNFIGIDGVDGSNIGKQRIGYDPDDTHLGGSLTMDTTVLFTAEITGSGNYWRVASKDTYTGKGWVAGHETQSLPISENAGSLMSHPLYEKETRVSTQHAWLRFSPGSPALLPYMGQLRQVQVPGRQEMFNPLTLQVMTTNERSVRSASLTYLEPSFRIRDLRKVKDGSDSAQIRARDLQLPRSLPAPVRALSRRLTDPENNRYDKAMAIVNYLHSSRFTYSTDNIPHPEANQDYVDQFLFETKTGYCDNFSSAMVVLLRASGIPARWVKGFTTGSYLGQDKKQRLNDRKTLTYTYQITNENAHSWVEVYFPTSGWVTFEPTPSFSDPSHFVSTAHPAGNSSTAQRSASSPSESMQQAKKSFASSNRSKLKEKAESRTDQRSVNHEVRQRTVWHRLTLMSLWRQATAALCALVGILLILLITTRKKWYPAWLFERLKKSGTDDHNAFLKAFAQLNKILAMKGFRRLPSETAGAFAQRIDRSLTGDGMTELTTYYERLIYGGEGLTDADYVAIGGLLYRIAGTAVSFKKVK